MRFLAAIAFAIAAAIAAPAVAAPDSPCAKAARGTPMLACLLDRTAQTLDSDAGAKFPDETAIQWVKFNEVAADAGDVARTRLSADRIPGGLQRRLAEARFAALLARNGDRKRSVAILDAMLAQPLAAGQVDWAIANVLVALNDPKRISAWLEGEPPDRRVNSLLALVRAQQEAGHLDRADRLLRDFGGKGSAEHTAIIVHSDTALDFVAAGRLDAAQRMLALLPDLDRPRIAARIALKQDELGKRAVAEKALDALLVASPRSSDAKLARALVYARHGDFAAAQKRFPSALSYDQALLDELLALLVKSGQANRALAMIGTMNNSKDKALAFARLSLVSSERGNKAEAARFLAGARGILDPLVNLKHGAAPLLIDYSTALGDTVKAMVALDEAVEGRAFTNQLEIAVQADRFGLARPGVMTGLIATNKALFERMVADGDPGSVRRVVTRPWRLAAAIAAYLDGGLVAEAVLIADVENQQPLGKTGDFLAIAQYIANH
ncbi:hypothetical protein [Emcibacter sp. SYSU 3D8]|uniref:tetratricopeptide repeat protein n=1 Tax=Emcibacter sp. SYSU 3D8 TaxID=3133969 RepID=UPI0031FF0C61